MYDVPDTIYQYVSTRDDDTGKSMNWRTVQSDLEGGFEILVPILRRFTYTSISR